MLKKHLKQSTWTIIVPLLGLLLAYGMIIYLPTRAAMAKDEKRLAELRMSIAEGPTHEKRIELAEQQLEETAAYIDTWYEQLVPADQVHGLFSQIAAACSKAQVKTTDFKPEKAVVRERIQEIPVELGAMGSFDQIWRLVCCLDRLPLVMWIDRLRFEADGKTGETLQCEADLVIFTRTSELSD